MCQLHLNPIVRKYVVLLRLHPSDLREKKQGNIQETREHCCPFQSLGRTWPGCDLNFLCIKTYLKYAITHKLLMVQKNKRKFETLHILLLFNLCFALFKIHVLTNKFGYQVLISCSLIILIPYISKQFLLSSLCSDSIWFVQCLIILQTEFFFYFKLEHISKLMLTTGLSLPLKKVFDAK